MEIPPFSPGKPEEKLDELKFATAFKAIQIALDDYQDIFSDFDTAPFHRRTLSDDFLKEIERRYVETEKGEFEVRLTLPESKREQKVESVIKKRLKDYFIMLLKEKQGDLEKRKKFGIIKILAGIATIVAVFEFPIIGTTSLATIFSVFAWYSMWSGYENLFEVPWKIERERNFLKKFSRARYYFISEEAVGDVLEKLPQEPSEHS